MLVRAGPDDALACPVEDFLDVLCGHQELVDAEFEAIVAANWPQAPTRPPQRRIRGGDHPDACVRRTGWALRGIGEGYRRIGAWPRQRSPPGHAVRTAAQVRAGSRLWAGAPPPRG